MKSSFKLSAVASLLFAAQICAAQIIIGQTAGFTGPVADGVKEISLGASLYIDSINAKGGVHGQKIEIRQMDDKFDPKLTAENAKTLLEDKSVLALFMTRGTPNTQAVLPLLESSGAALVAPSTGAIALHQPLQKYVFNVRSTYQYEAEKVISHFTHVGINKIAVVHVDDTFGADALTGAKAGFESVKIKPVAIEKLAREKPDFDAMAKAVQASNPQLVAIFASSKFAAEAIKAISSKGKAPQFVTLSNNASSGFAKSAGPGVIVSQVFPYERSGSVGIVKEINELAKSRKEPVAVSPAMLEGFAAAKVLVEGLRKAGPNTNRAKLRSALESLDNYDLGGMVLSFGPTDHTGLRFAEMSTTTSEGKFIR